MAELAEHNCSAHSASLEFTTMGDSKNLSPPVNQWRNGTVPSNNEHSVGRVTQTSLTIVYYAIMANIKFELC